MSRRRSSSRALKARVYCILPGLTSPQHYITKLFSLIIVRAMPPLSSVESTTLQQPPYMYHASPTVGDHDIAIAVTGTLQRDQGKEQITAVICCQAEQNPANYKYMGRCYIEPNTAEICISAETPQTICLCFQLKLVGGENFLEPTGGRLGCALERVVIHVYEAKSFRIAVGPFCRKQRCKRMEIKKRLEHLVKLGSAELR